MNGLFPVDENAYWLLIDKPSDWTSFDVVAKVRRITRIKKVGHAGSLDPMATGLLVVALGKGATKQLHVGLEGGKSYRAIIKLGLASPTFDIDAENTYLLKAPEFDRLEIEETLSFIKNKGYQVPPMVSSIKRKGKRFYHLALKGWWMEREARKVQIDKLDLIDYDSESGMITIEVAGGGGLYVRTIAADLGKILGIPAALTSLRRLSVGQWKIEDSITIDELARSWGEETDEGFQARN